LTGTCEREWQRDFFERVRRGKAVRRPELLIEGKQAKSGWACELQVKLLKAR